MWSIDLPKCVINNGHFLRKIKVKCGGISDVSLRTSKTFFVSLCSTLCTLNIIKYKMSGHTTHFSRFFQTHLYLQMSIVNIYFMYKYFIIAFITKYYITFHNSDCASQYLQMDIFEFVYILFVKKGQWKFRLDAE